MGLPEQLQTIPRMKDDNTTSDFTAVINTALQTGNIVNSATLTDQEQISAQREAATMETADMLAEALAEKGIPVAKE